MQIQFKQTAIESAIRDYVENQGFSLRGRSVTMSFTAGRKNGGLTVDVDISDVADIPGYGANDHETDPVVVDIAEARKEPVLKAVTVMEVINTKATASIATETPKVAAVASPAFDPDPAPVVAEAQVKTTKAKAEPKEYDLQPEAVAQKPEPSVETEATKPVSLFG